MYATRVLARAMYDMTMHSGFLDLLWNTFGVYCRPARNLRLRCFCCFCCFFDMLLDLLLLYVDAVCGCRLALHRMLPFLAGLIVSMWHGILVPGIRCARVAAKNCLGQSKVHLERSNPSESSGPSNCSCSTCHTVTLYLATCHDLSFCHFVHTCHFITLPLCHFVTLPLCHSVTVVTVAT